MMLKANYHYLLARRNEIMNIKQYEFSAEDKIMDVEYIVVRFGGGGISRIFRAPIYEEEYLSVLYKTFKRLLSEFSSIVCGFTFNDEMSFLINVKELSETRMSNHTMHKCLKEVLHKVPKKSYEYSLQNILSVMASKVSVYFNLYLGLEAEKITDDLKRQKYRRLVGNVCFDAKIIKLPANKFMEYFINRQEFCICNALERIRNIYLPEEKCLNSNEILGKLKEYGINYESIPQSVRTGYFGYSECMRVRVLDAPEFARSHVLKNVLMSKLTTSYQLMLNQE